MRVILLITSFLLLLQGSAIAGKVSADILVSESNSWDGGAFKYPKGKAKITVQKINIKPDGKKVSLSVHCHTIPLAAYVSKGSVEVIKPSGESKLFKAGSAFVEVLNKWHKGVFVENTQLIAFYAGAKGVPLSFSTSSAPKKCK